MTGTSILSPNAVYAATICAVRLEPPAVVHNLIEIGARNSTEAEFKALSTAADEWPLSEKWRHHHCNLHLIGIEDFEEVQDGTISLVSVLGVQYVGKIWPGLASAVFALNKVPEVAARLSLHSFGLQFPTQEGWKLQAVAKDFELDQYFGLATAT